jgi:hypothetical protein
VTHVRRETVTIDEKSGDEVTITAEDGSLIRGGQMIGIDDEVIGVIGSMLLDPVATTPQWVQVDCDGAGFTAVPLLDARLDGQVLRVPFTGAQVRAAPEQGHTDLLTPDDEDALRVYYTQLRARESDQR